MLFKFPNLVSFLLQEREEDQRTLMLTWECLRLLGNALVALSDLRLNLMSPVPRHLHVVRPFSHYATPVTLPGAMHHHIPAQVRKHKHILVKSYSYKLLNLTRIKLTVFVSISTNRWTWVLQWLLQLTALRDKPHPPSRPASRSRQVRDRPPPHRLPRPISRLDRDRLAPGSSGSATRQSRWSWCRWTRTVCCPLPATDWMFHCVKAVCVLIAGRQCIGVSTHTTLIHPVCTAATSNCWVICRMKL